MPLISAPRARQKRSPFRSSAVVVLPAVLVLGALTVHLGMGGEIPIPFTNRTLSLAPAAAAERDDRPGEAPPGFLRVPISARAIDAYAQVSREDLIDTGARALATFLIRESALPEDAVRDPAGIIGRVLRKPKGKGYLFREQDFLEEGTRPGLVAGIPAGKRAFRVDVSTIDGLYGLQLGDRFDVIASLPIESDPADAQLRKFGGVYAPQLALDAAFRNLTKTATVRVLVQSGIVVSPVETRYVPVVAGSLTQGQVTRTRPVQEMVIAIDPEEIAALTEALAVEAKVTAFARSGRPDDPAESVTPVPEPFSPFSDTVGGGGMRIVETILGSARQLQPVPSARLASGRSGR